MEECKNIKWLQILILTSESQFKNKLPVEIESFIFFTIEQKNVKEKANNALMDLLVFTSFDW